MSIIIIIGPTGCGKTRAAYERDPGLYSVPSAKSSGTYWDSYEGSATVLVDEMYGNRFTWSFLLRLCDRYSMRVPVHGAQGVNFTSEEIIFTSNAHPKEWYPKQTERYGWSESNPFVRRISFIQNSYYDESDSIELNRYPTEGQQKIALKDRPVRPRSPTTLYMSKGQIATTGS